ncbi:uncharacterized protein MELLADRAFT_101983 [Melampsora larici-populina 98AG31]|uniref:Uncharacterized protein n=1 Tax=Melampsora larici-populina (strain 98AG31 / pathotype 3-4-7) TaxID=747676 RepID=F4R5L0_MELLP|nr:uncharacterized protein MELLADRAFT_101983 [Melampsora larici-populina 98AG31]EGG12241.1 hypothetical protein MELLADRAFT_101983 [Melampsora larici-populina 98AG31]
MIEFVKQWDLKPPCPRANIGELLGVVTAFGWFSFRVVNQRYWNKRSIDHHRRQSSQSVEKSQGLSHAKSHLGLHAGTSTSRHAQAADRIKRNQVNLKKLLESAARRREQESHWHSGSYWHPSASPSYTRHYPSPTPHRPSYYRTSSPEPTSSSTPCSFSPDVAPTSLPTSQHNLEVSSSTLSDLISSDFSTHISSNCSYPASQSIESSGTRLPITPLHTTSISKSEPMTSCAITTDPVLHTLSTESPVRNKSEEWTYKNHRGQERIMISTSVNWYHKPCNRCMKDSVHMSQNIGSVTLNGVCLKIDIEERVWCHMSTSE